MKKLNFLLFLSLTIFACPRLPTETNTSSNEEICGYSPDEEYLSIWKNPNSLQNKRIQFLNKYPANELYDFNKLEFINDTFRLLKLPLIQEEVIEEEPLLTSRRNIPITAHIVRRNNDTGGFTEANLNDAVTNVNNFYNNFNMNFHLCSIRFIDSDDIFDTTFSSIDDGDGTPNASFEVLDVTSRNAERTLNIYFVPNSDGSWTWRPSTDDIYQHILMNNSQARNGVTLSHEIGHWFGLLHTHGSSNTELTDELVDGSNCSSAGDFVCDTPADPNLTENVDSSCNYTGDSTLVDKQGDEFAPDTENILSYARNSCRNRFTEEQILKMQSAYLGMETDRGYTFFCCQKTRAWVHHSTDSGFEYKSSLQSLACFSDSQKWLSGDFNGDGRDDLVNLYGHEMDDGSIKTRAWVHHSFGSGFEYRSSFTTLAGFWDEQKWLSGDFNGDGRDDLVNLYGHKMDDGSIKTQAWVHHSTGSGFEYRSSFTTLAGFWDEQKWLSGDFNGDGRDDLVNLYGHKMDDGSIKTQAWVHHSTGSGFEYRSSFTTLAGFWDEQKWLSGDFNGDGRDDLVNLYGHKIDDGSIKTQAWAHHSTGSGFEYRSSFTTLAEFWDEQKWLSGDFNGDGKDDLVNLYGHKIDNGSIKTRAWVHDSNGSGFEYRSSFTTLAGFWDEQKWLSGDFNDDGKSDLVNLYGGSF